MATTGKFHKKGFTLIEVITAIVVISIIMIPVALIVMEYVRASSSEDAFAVARELANQEMVIVSDTEYSDPTLAIGYDHLTPNYMGYNFDLRRKVTAAPIGGVWSSSAKRVEVDLYPHGSSQSVANLFLEITDVEKGAGSAGGALGSECDSFNISGGALRRNDLYRATVQNVRTTGNITVTGFIIISSMDKTITSVNMGQDTKLQSSVTVPANTPTTVTLTKTFIINSGISYSGASGCTITFANAPNQAYSVSLRFIFSDGSQEAAWHVWNK